MDCLPASVSRPLPPAAGAARALYRPAADPSAGAAPAAPRRPAVVHPESLHPGVWLGHQLGRHADAAVPSGFALLDAQLPGGGWPRRVLTELLLPHPGVGEIRLLGASLVATQQAGRLVMLFDPPAQLSALALARLGFDVEQLLVINTRARLIAGSDSLWALEQALKSGHVGAVLAWLPPRLRAERLRRLQLAAHAHDGPAFVLREMSAAQRPTAAPLRLGLRANGADALAVHVLKRRGPPLAAPVQLALPPVLSGTALQRARSSAVRANVGTAGAGPTGVGVAGAGPAGVALAGGEPAGVARAGGEPAGGEAAGRPGPDGLHAATFVNLAAG
ncbi:MAG: translesion DNA synthesis-associated protein ImuA [Burkholderiales bacterium]|nr:translesion DNA synthesis-associated protein ImuA [Burkholderiales bacterium]